MSLLTRRSTLGLAAAMAAAPKMLAAQTTKADELIDLWPGSPPGAMGARIVRTIEQRLTDPAHPDRWVRGIDRPVLVVRRPKHPNGAAMMVVPGGGYGFLSYDNEGTTQAAWLNALGVTAFILLYRLPSEGWKRREDVPLQDAQRAIRLIRARAADFSVDPKRVGVLGFSAGGHLAGSLATRHGETLYTAIDAADRIDARPDIAALLYPVVSLDASFSHGGSRDMLLGEGAPATLRRAQSVDLRVGATTPPTFLVHAADDGLVPVANSILLFQAMQAAQRPAALHVFEDGGHGFGVRLPQTMQAAAWPKLLETFAAKHGVLR